VTVGVPPPVHERAVQIAGLPRSSPRERRANVIVLHREAGYAARRSFEAGDGRFERTEAKARKPALLITMRRVRARRRAARL
jgi:hypothetical protein